MKTFLAIITLSFIMASCAYNKTELPEPIEEEVITITYTNYVETMIQDNHCLECHVSGSSGAAFNYTTYNGIKAVALSGTLKDRAIDNNGVSMPQGYAALPQNVKDTLQMWIDQGALE